MKILTMPDAHAYSGTRISYFHDVKNVSARESEVRA
jgi:hypothetical protein